MYKKQKRIPWNMYTQGKQRAKIKYNRPWFKNDFMLTIKESTEKVLTLSTFWT